MEGRGCIRYLHMSCRARRRSGGSVSSAIRDKSVSNKLVPCTMKVQRGSSTPGDEDDDDDDDCRVVDVTPMRDRAL